MTIGTTLGYELKTFTVKYSLGMEQLVPIVSVQQLGKQQCKNSIVPKRKTWTACIQYISSAVKFRKSIS